VKRSYYFGIDIVRFACALAVAAFHIGFSCWASPASGGAKLLQHSYALPDLAGLLWPGWVGVEIFFVISGFVISGSAEKANAVSFVKSRMLRLYPAAWICATITLVVLLINHHARAKAYLSSLLLFPGGPWIDGQYWTLGVEIIFYALVFVLIVLGRKNLIYALAAVIGLASTLTTVAIFLGADQLAFLSRGVWRLTLLNYGADFALGIMIHAWASGRMDRWKLALSAIFLVGVAAEIREHTAGMSDRVVNAPFALVDRWELALLLFLVGLAGILLSIRHCAAFDRWPDTAKGLLRRLGLATYPLYLLHFSVGVALVRELVQAGVPPVPALLLGLAVLVLAAVAIAEFAEPAVRRGLRWVLDRIESSFVVRWLPAKFFAS
jgi:peptidoglycan/LPS O-acetylase OafA/YrhL